MSLQLELRTEYFDRHLLHVWPPCCDSCMGTCHSQYIRSLIPQQYIVIVVSGTRWQTPLWVGITWPVCISVSHDQYVLVNYSHWPNPFFHSNESADLPFIIVKYTYSVTGTMPCTILRLYLYHSRTCWICSNVKCHGTLVDVTCHGTLADVTCHGTLADVTCHGTLADVICHGILSDVTCHGTLADVCYG